MIINVIISINPFYTSSASANRWLTLIEGLSKLGASVKLLIYGGYQSNKESEALKIEGIINDITYKYISPQLIKGYWKRRYYNYIGDKFRKSGLVKLILKEIENNKGIIWTDSSHFGFELAVKLKKQQPYQQLFLELSEFLDIHKYNKGNFLQRWIANERQKFFEDKAFHIYNGLALMTRTLFKHYRQFPEPRPELLHLPMTVNLERFSFSIEPPPDFEKPYIAFVGVMNDAKDGVSIIINIDEIKTDVEIDDNMFIFDKTKYPVGTNFNIETD